MCILLGAVIHFEDVKCSLRLYAQLNSCAFSSSWSVSLSHGFISHTIFHTIHIHLTMKYMYLPMLWRTQIACYCTVVVVVVVPGVTVFYHKVHTIIKSIFECILSISFSVSFPVYSIICMLYEFNDAMMAWNLNIDVDDDGGGGRKLYHHFLWKLCAMIKAFLTSHI